MESRQPIDAFQSRLAGVDEGRREGFRVTDRLTRVDVETSDAI